MGAFGENFPYSNFHDLNLDWIITVIKDFLAKYNDIDGAISEGKAELQAELQTILSSLEELSETEYQEFANRIRQKGEQTVATIPSDYTTLANLVENEAIKVKTFVTYAQMPESYRDCDTLPLNTVIGFKFGWTDAIAATMKHFPYTGFAGDIMTINTVKDGSAWGAQLAFSENNPTTGMQRKLYYRTRYTSWEDWMEIPNSADTIIVHDAFTSYANTPTTYRDCNNLPFNSVIGYRYGWTDEQAATMLNFPTSPFLGEILTINTNKNNQAVVFQIAIEEAPYYLRTNDRIFYRVKYNSWSSWTDIPNKTYYTGAHKALDRFVLCGDSLSVSVSYDAQSNYKNVTSWAYYMNPLYGCMVYAKGGIKTAQYLTDSTVARVFDSTIVNDYKHAIVYLGTNDSAQQTEIADFRTAYQTLVNRLLSSGYEYVLCVSLMAATCPNSNREQYNTVIKSICDSTAKVYYLNMTPYNNRIASFVTQNHLNSAGYASLASCIADAIDIAMLDFNPDYPS